MKLLTHNTMTNNTAEASGKGFPLKITAREVRVDEPTGEENEQEEISFVKGVLGMLDWPALVKGASQLGLTTLPPILTDELANDPAFLKALYHVLMNVHLIKGILTCPATGKEFAVTNSIPNMMLEEEECENPRL